MQNLNQEPLVAKITNIVHLHSHGSLYLLHHILIGKAILHTTYQYHELLTELQLLSMEKTEKQNYKFTWKGSYKISRKHAATSIKKVDYKYVMAERKVQKQEQFGVSEYFECDVTPSANYSYKSYKTRGHNSTQVKLFTDTKKSQDNNEQHNP